MADTVLESTGAAVLLLRADGMIVRVNPAAAALLSAPAHSLVGQDAAGLLARPREVATLRQALCHVAKSGAPSLHETHLDGPDGYPAEA